MKKVSALIVTILIFVMYRPRIVHAFTFEPSDVLPGDVLFSPVGKRESKYVGHIGIVTTDKKVLHSIPAGLMKDEPDAYKRKFRKIAHYRPYEQGTGLRSAAFAEDLYHRHPEALYRIHAPLNGPCDIQYCTKIVWQSYYAAGINLGALSEKARAVHPLRLLDDTSLYPLKRRSNR
ncbi:hypothetical protein [Halobacillus litoralis]|uniref:hypothetical protein n=1 Tax=Halobacillus litoralis TaxID=45668 RepID=UPI001CD69DB9|nr:hypothetical protein [Halobacillus litoralis]MCA1023195.1 hypothetical protein [Halobacillus litoralis]